MGRESTFQCPFEGEKGFNGKRDRVSAHSRGKRGSMGREIMFQCPSERENRFISVPI
jgi:hypothetical protein